MELHFKPQFAKDFLNIKNREVKVLLASHLKQIANADTISQIGNITKLEEYESRYKLRITVNEKDDYRLGLEIRKNIVWIERVLRRPRFYEHYRR